jgi:hypothetical protein
MTLVSRQELVTWKLMAHHSWSKVLGTVSLVSMSSKTGGAVMSLKEMLIVVSQLKGTEAEKSAVSFASVLVAMVLL